jgi:GMP synthase-like glutamine amidotransferase
MTQYKIRTAVIDLYNNERNEGMRCIKEIISDSNKRFENATIYYDIFNARHRGEIPDLSYDIYISSGGPGDPFDGEGTKWESDYFSLIDKIRENNENPSNRKKYIFFICHSFQLMSRYFKFAEVTTRPKRSFGILPIERTESGAVDPILKHLSNPFYAADFRQYQVVNPNYDRLKELNASILSMEILPENEKITPALMAVRISNEIVGTQFHPEADPESMMYHFKQPERKLQVTERYGEAMYHEMLSYIEHPDKIKLTRKSVLPGFLDNAIQSIIIR